MDKCATGGGPGGIEKSGDILLDVSSLGECLARVVDGRHRRGIRYPLRTILVLLVLAKLAGEDRVSGIGGRTKHRGRHRREDRERNDRQGASAGRTSPRGLSYLPEEGIVLMQVAAGGDYIWVAKDNQPTLRADIEHLFAPDAPTSSGVMIPHDFQTTTTVNKGHGRRETVDGLTSLSQPTASPPHLLDLTRIYWGIENGLLGNARIRGQQIGLRRSIGQVTENQLNRDPTATNDGVATTTLPPLSHT